jgi:hypothetical protein
MKYFNSYIKMEQIRQAIRLSEYTYIDGEFGLIINENDIPKILLRTRNNKAFIVNAIEPYKLNYNSRLIINQQKTSDNIISSIRCHMSNINKNQFYFYNIDNYITDEEYNELLEKSNNDEKNIKEEIMDDINISKTELKSEIFNNNISIIQKINNLRLLLNYNHDIKVLLNYLYDNLELEDDNHKFNILLQIAELFINIDEKNIAKNIYEALLDDFSITKEERKRLKELILYL